MLGFELNEEQETFRRTVRTSPATWSRPRRMPTTKAATSRTTWWPGWPSGAVRTAVSGGVRRDGRRLLRPCLTLEELARADSSVAITLEAGVSLGAMPIYRFGTEAQKQQWLPELCAGRGLAAFGLTEPAGGSDAGATSTTAQLDNGEWVINGSKSFITNAGTDITRFVTVTAVTGELAERPQGDLVDPRAGGHARLLGLEEVLEGGLARVRHARAVLR